MPTTPLAFPKILDAARGSGTPVAWKTTPSADAGANEVSFLTLGGFREAALALTEILAARSERRWALCFDDAANFAAAFLAVLHAGKQVVLPGHNRTTVLHEMQAAGAFDAILCDSSELSQFVHPAVPFLVRWDADQESSSASQESPRNPHPADAATVTFFTSGSTGHPKGVVKTLEQLQIENDLHAAHWGRQLLDGCVAGTTAHHHLYGFQFRVLLPLTLGVPFNAALIETHEQLLVAPRPFALIASPAFLKRLDSALAFAEHADDEPPCRHILSAGGVLPEDTARAAAEIFRRAPFEIFGSTEAGAMAWRDTAAQPRTWTPLPGVSVAEGEGGRMVLKSPFLPPHVQHKHTETDDAVRLLPDGTFELLGRLDRIVKIEEKRISLPEVESRLRAIEGVKDAAVLALTAPAGASGAQRTFLAAALVLDDEACACRAAVGSGRYLLELRTRLRPVLEAVAIPRNIRIVPHIPENSQGKRDASVIARLLAPTLPEELHRELRDSHGKVLQEGGRGESAAPATASITFRLEPELLWFKGHFDSHPILPGVVQIHWAAHYAREIFAALLPADAAFTEIPSVKFRHPLRPDDKVRLDLTWHPSTQHLTFTWFHNDQTASTGTLGLPKS